MPLWRAITIRVWEVGILLTAFVPGEESTGAQKLKKPRLPYQSEGTDCLDRFRVYWVPSSSPWASLPRLGASLILPFPKVAQSTPVLLFSRSHFFGPVLLLFTVCMHVCFCHCCMWVFCGGGCLLVAIWYREIGRGAAHLSAQDPVEVREGAIQLKGPCNSALPLWGQSACLLHLKIKRLLFHLEANVVESPQKPCVFLPVSATQTRPTIRSHQTWFVYQKHG